MQRIDVQISSNRQKISSVIATRDFLWRLSNPQMTPRVPGVVRSEARALLRHFPPAGELRPVLMEGYGDEFDELTPPRIRNEKREPNGNRWLL